MIELERAREFLEGAEVAEREGLYNVCAVCCYAAIYWAARAAARRRAEQTARAALKRILVSPPSP
mgnify:CR=1 FL=1